jgi:hypothetical protein
MKPTRDSAYDCAAETLFQNYLAICVLGDEVNTRLCCWKAIRILLVNCVLR